MTEPLEGPGLQRVVTRDLSSGRFHKRYRIAGRMYSQEGCNLDQAGGYEVMPRQSRGIDGRGVPVGTDPALLCENCFGSDDNT